MTISFSNALGIHEDAVRFRSHRSSVLANNLANVNTPNYKARDLDFKQALAERGNPQGRSLDMAITDNAHRFGEKMDMQAEGLLYRTPSQPSIDGNTVEEHVEHAQFMRNSLDFQTSFTFLNSKFKGLMSAIRGE